MKDANEKVNTPSRDGADAPIESPDRDKPDARKPKPRRKELLPSIPFFVVLALLTVAAGLLPLRPEVSEVEKRRLEEFPAFSFSDLISGSFFEGVDRWFSDTFTFRDSWIDLANRVESLHGRGSIVIYGDIPEGSDEPASPDTTAPEADEPPQSEEVKPDTAPVETPSPEPEEDAWGGEVLNDDEFFSIGTVIQIGDAVYPWPGVSEYWGKEYAEVMNKAAQLLEGRANVYTISIPSHITYMVSRADREFMGLAIEEDGLEYMYSQMNEDVHYVDIFDTLVKHNSEYLCFRSDHHWTALGAYYAYVAWCDVAGVEPVSLDEYETLEYPGFLGTTFLKAQKSSSIVDNPDTVFCYVPPGDVHLYIQRSNSDDLGVEVDLILDQTNSSSANKYMAFLQGDHPKCTFINNDITDGSACLIIKNSHGNPFAYYYTQHYQYVYVLDPRKYYHRSLTSFVDEYDVDDVIFCLSSNFAMSEKSNGIISYFVK